MKSYGQCYTTLVVCIEEAIWAAHITYIMAKSLPININQLCGDFQLATC